MVDRDGPAEPMDSRVSFVTMNPMIAHTSRAGRANLGASNNSSNSSDPTTSQNSMEGFDFDFNGDRSRSTGRVGEHHSLIYDAVSVNFSWRIFFAQIIIQVVPFLGLLLQPCMKEDFEIFGYALSLVYNNSDSSIKYFLLNQIPPFCIVVGVLCYNLMPNEPEPGWPHGKRCGLMSGNIVVPCLTYLLHRLTVCFKYATLHNSEYARFIGAGRQQSIVYNNQMQLLTSWKDSRVTELHAFHSKAAECTANVDLSENEIKISDPKRDNMSKYRFIQWQAYMMDTCDLTIFTDELDPKLEGVILPDAENKGGYVINGRVVLLKILKTVDKGKQVLSREYEIATKIENFLVMGYPIIRAIVYLCKAGAAASLTPGQWILLILEFLTTTVVLFYLKTSISLFFVTLLNDSERRLSEAEVLKEFIRSSEIVFDNATVRLGRSPNNRRGVESFSKAWIDLNHRERHPDVVLFADRVIEEELYQVVGGKASEGDSSNAEEYIDGDWEDGKDMSDHSNDIKNIAKFLGRTPRIEIKDSGKTNMATWLAIRDTLRNLGIRYKFRMDFFAVMLTLTNFSALLIIVTSHLMTQHTAADGDVHKEVSPLVNFDSSFSVQTIITTSLFVYCLLGNVAAAVKTNEKYEEHQYVLQNAVMAAETEYAKDRENLSLSLPAGTLSSLPATVSTNTSLNDLAHITEVLEEEEEEAQVQVQVQAQELSQSQAQAEEPEHASPAGLMMKLRKLKDSLEALEVAIMSVRVTDKATPLCILYIPANWTLYLTIITGLVTLATSLTSAFSTVTSPQV